MGLKIYNQRPKSEFIIQLVPTPLAQIKTCVASIGGGSIAADLAVSAFKFVAAPMVVTTLGVAMIFLFIADNIESYMGKRALDKGDVNVKISHRPKIEP